MMEGTAAPADFCFVHFTDTHIMAGRIPGKLDTSASLQRVIEVLTALEPRPAFAILGGDLVSPDLLDRNRTLTQEEYEPSYHLWPLGLAWIDAMNLRNGEELMGVLRQHPDVRWMICGHVHLDQEIQRQGLTMLTTPATCFQVSKVSQTFKTLPGPPGFRLVRIKGGEFSTRVLHLHGDGLAAL